MKLPIGFNSSWFVSWNSDESINRYKKIIYHTEKLDDINIKAKIIEDCEFKIKLLSNMTPVSYTHLDVYKRQELFNIYERS